MSKVCQQYMIHHTHRPIQSQREEIFQYTRVNSPGLPNSSLRSSCKREKKKIEIGLVTDRKLSESPKLERLLQTCDIKLRQSHNSVTEIPYPQSALPKMEPPEKRNLRRIEKLESDKLCLEIYMSEEDNNQLIFTGISKERLLSPDQNKQAILQNLQQLFQYGISGQNQYIKLESLEKNLISRNQEYHGITKKQYNSSTRRQQTLTNDTKSIADKSLSISTIKEYKSNTSSKTSKEIELIEQGIQRFNLKSKIKEKIKQPTPLSQHNNIALNQRQKSSKSPFLKNPCSSSSKCSGKDSKTMKNKPQYTAKSMHI